MKVFKKRIILVRGQNFASGGQIFTGGQNFASLGPNSKFKKNKYFFKKVIFQI